MSFICILTLTYISLTRAADIKYEIELWSKKDFSGSRLIVEIQKEEMDNCYSLDKTWQDSISSINSHGSCLDVYKEENCGGNASYIYPGTPSHNILEDVELDDVIKSFRLCDLDESTTCRICRNPLKRGGPEYGFWHLFFEKYRNKIYLREFEKRAADSWYISWDFIHGLEGSTKGRQYQLALEWVMKQIEKDVFTRSTWNRLNSLAIQVRNYRSEINVQHLSWRGSKFDSVSLTIENKWGEIVDALDRKLHAQSRKAQGEVG